MAVKHFIIVGGLAGVGYLYLTKKVADWSKTMLELVPLPSGFRDFTFKNWIVKFTLDMTVYNPTTEDFNPNGVIAILKRIEIKDQNNTLIAKIDVNRRSIRIPAEGKLKVENLVVEIDTKANIMNAKNLAKIKSVDDIRTDAIISILGKEYVISQ